MQRQQLHLCTIARKLAAHFKEFVCRHLHSLRTICKRSAVTAAINVESASSLLRFGEVQSQASSAAILQQIMHGQQIFCIADIASCQQRAIRLQLQTAARPALINKFHLSVHKGIDSIQLLAIIAFASFFIIIKSKNQLRHLVIIDVQQRIAKMLYGLIGIKMIAQLVNARCALLRQAFCIAISQKIVDAIYNICIFQLIGRHLDDSCSSGCRLRLRHLCLRRGRLLLCTAAKQRGGQQCQQHAFNQLTPHHAISFPLKTD